MAKQKLLVTGGLGFIGHNVVRLLENLGHEVTIVDSQTDYGIIPHAELSFVMNERSSQIQRSAVFHADITDNETIDRIMNDGFDTVIHLASFPRQKIVNANPQWGSQIMSQGLLNLLEASTRHGIQKFVYVSSSMVYGDFENGVREEHACRPLGQYGILKLAGEWLVRDYTVRTGMLHSIVRPSAVYGPRDVEDRVVSKFLLAAMRGEEIQVHGPEEQLDFTYVDDVAQGIILATIKDEGNCRTFNITRGQGRTLLEAAELAIKIAGQGSLKIYHRDYDYPSRGTLNIEHAQRDLGFNPTIDIEQGFENYYQWLKSSVYWS